MATKTDKKFETITLHEEVDILLLQRVHQKRLAERKSDANHKADEREYKKSLKDLTSLAAVGQAIEAVPGDTSIVFVDGISNRRLLEMGPARASSTTDVYAFLERVLAGTGMPADGVNSILRDLERARALECLTVRVTEAKVVHPAEYASSTVTENSGARNLKTL